MSLSGLSDKSVQQQLVPTMANWRGAWDISGQYFYGDIVQGSDNNGYVAMVYNIGNDPVGGALPSPWLSLAQSGASGGMNYANAVWNGATNYPSEDVVRGANGATYVATAPSAGVNPVIDVSGALPAVSGSKWARLSGANVVVPWNGSTQYGVGDMVQATQPNGQIGLFQAVAPNSNSTPTTANSNWVGLADEIGSSMSYIGDWSGSVSYDKQDVVSYSGYGWVSQSNANSNNTPSFTASNYWVPMAGVGSVVQVHHKEVAPASNAFFLTSNYTPGTWETIFTIPNTAGATESGAFTLNGVFGLTASNADTARFTVSDLSNNAPSSNAVFSYPLASPIVNGSLQSISGTANYQFSNAPATLYINFSADQAHNAYALSSNTYYSYTNTITPVQFIADP